MLNNPMIKKYDISSMSEQDHEKYHRRLIYIMIVIVLILFSSATFYHFVENWRYLDALYFSAATMTTVGYGDITPKTDLGKIFTIVYVFAGVGIALYGISLIAAHFVEVGEEFWLHQLGKMKFKHHTETFWGKIKDVFNYDSKKITEEYEEDNNHKK